MTTWIAAGLQQTDYRAACSSIRVSVSLLIWFESQSRVKIMQHVCTSRTCDFPCYSHLHYQATCLCGYFRWTQWCFLPNLNWEPISSLDFCFPLCKRIELYRASTNFQWHFGTGYFGNSCYVLRTMTSYQEVIQTGGGLLFVTRTSIFYAPAIICYLHLMDIDDVWCENFNRAMSSDLFRLGLLQSSWDEPHYLYHSTIRIAFQRTCG